MKFPKPKTFRDATSPTTSARWALGIGTVEYPAGRPRRILSLCWSVAWLIIVLISGWMSLDGNMWTLERSSVSWNNYYIAMAIFSMNNITIIYRGYANSKKFQDCLFKLDRVSKTLNKLGIPNDYELLFRSQVFFVIGICLYVLMAIPMYMLRSVSAISVSIVLVGYVIVSIYQLATSLLEDYTFCSCIRYIGQRYRHLNALLIKSSIDLEAVLPADHDIPWLLPPTVDIHPRFRCVSIAHNQWMMARKVHSDLRNVAEDLNNIFGAQILFSVAIAFCMITAFLTDLYTRLMMPTENTADGSFILIVQYLPLTCYYLLKVFAMLSTCSTTSTEAQVTGELIYEVITPTTCDQIREEVQDHKLYRVEINDWSPLRQTILQLEIGEDLSKFVAAESFFSLLNLYGELLYRLKKFFSSKGTKVSKEP